jgi:hypothetical protein
MNNLLLELGGIEADRPMQAGVLYVPRRLELTDDAILWNGPLKDVRPGPGLLKDFVELYDKSDQEIFHYARRWGVLGICKHGVPASHNDYPFGVQHGVEGCLPVAAERQDWHSDPLESWRYFSKIFRAIRDLGAHVNQNQVGDPSDWRRVLLIREGDPPWKNVRKARTVLSWKLQDLLDIGQVRPQVTWDKDKQQWQIEMGAHSVPNLFGLVSLSLVLSIFQRELVICSSCGNPYTPDRRPNPWKRNYCEGCGLKAARRDASREYRRRLREKKQEKMRG